MRCASTALFWSSTIIYQCPSRQCPLRHCPLQHCPSRQLFLGTIFPRDIFYNRPKQEKKDHNSNKRFALFTWSSSSNIHSVAVLTFTLGPLLTGALHNSHEFLLLKTRSLTNADFASIISFCSNNLIVLFLHLSRAWLVMVLTLHWKEDHGCKIKDYLQNWNVTHWKR